MLLLSADWRGSGKNIRGIGKRRVGLENEELAQDASSSTSAAF